jgi:hypothetical protein
MTDLIQIKKVVLALPLVFFVVLISQADSLRRSQVDPDQPYPKDIRESSQVDFYPNARYPRGMPSWRNLENVDPRTVVLPWQADAIFNDDDARYRIAWHGSHYGGMPENAGDFNHDGVDDFINMSHFAYVDGKRKAGEVHVWFGKKNGFFDPRIEVPDVIFYGDEAEARLGISVAGIGDFNGDGYDDIAISAAFRTTRSPYDGSLIKDAGAVYVVFGGPQWNSGERPKKVRIEDVGRSVPGLVIRGGFDGNLMLAWANGLEGGDVNGDGLADVIIGSYNPYVDSPFMGKFKTRAFVVYGSKGASGEYSFAPGGGFRGRTGLHYTLIEAETEALPLEIGESGDRSLALGAYIVSDINGDGLKEIAIARSDSAYIYFGRRDFPEKLSLSDADLIVRGGQGSGDLGKIQFHGIQSIRPAGDVNCDGFQDLLITARDTTSDSQRVGAVGILYGGNVPRGRIGFDKLGTVIIGQQPEGSVGQPAMDRSGDLDGDGCSDILINDAYYLETIGGTTQPRGRLWVIKGRSDMPKLMYVERDAALTFVADTTVPGLFGFTWNTGDWNGDGKLDIVIGDHYAGDKDAVWHAGKTYMYYNGYGFSLKKHLR